MGVQKKPSKPYIYLIIYVILWTVYYLSRRMNWQLDIDLHTLMEMVGSILSIFIAVFAYVRYFSKKNNMYLFISTGFLVEGSFRGIHAILTSRFLIDFVPPYINTWIFVVARFVFPILLLLSYYTWKKENSMGHQASIDYRKLYKTLISIFALSFVGFLLIPDTLFVPNPIYYQVYHIESNLVPIINKLPISVYLLVIILYLKKGEWKFRKFDHWVIISLIFAFKAEVILTFSKSKLDVFLFHLYKDLGYLLLLIGLINTMYQLFKRAEESAIEIKRMNNSLSIEVYERHDLEKSLMENEERYRLLVEYSPDLIAVNTNGKWSYINTTGRKMLDASCKSDLIGRNIMDFIYPEDQEVVKQTIAKIIEKGRNDHMLERRLVSLDNRIIHVEIQAIVTDFLNEQSILILARDISERKKTEELLRRSEKLSVVGEIAAGIAHEIKNPLTSLNGFIQLIQNDEAEKEEYYEIMLSELGRIERIISDLLVLGESQSINKKSKNVCGLLDHVITLYRQQALENKIQIIKDSEPDIPLIQCEESQMKQVFINILKNAIEAMPNGGVLSIEVKLLTNQIRIRFTDQGKGIPSDILKKLGEPFVTTKENGTGLGLMISRRIIENHQGSLKFDSKLDQGTIVDICLPV